MQPEWLELARIDLLPTTIDIRLPADAARPGPGEIDQSHVEPARARAVVEVGIKPELRELIIDRMRENASRSPP